MYLDGDYPIILLLQKKYSENRELQLCYFELRFRFCAATATTTTENQHSKLIILKLSPVYKLLVYIFVVGDGSYETDLNQFLRSFEQTYFA